MREVAQVVPKLRLTHRTRLCYDSDTLSIVCQRILVVESQRTASEWASRVIPDSLVFDSIP